MSSQLVLIMAASALAAGSAHNVPVRSADALVSVAQSGQPAVRTGNCFVAVPDAKSLRNHGLAKMFQGRKGALACGNARNFAAADGAPAPGMAPPPPPPTIFTPSFLTSTLVTAGTTAGVTYAVTSSTVSPR